MRLKYLDNPSAAERSARDDLIAHIDAWWKSFAAEEPAIEAHLMNMSESDYDLPGFIGRHLDAIHPQIMWEIGPPIRGEGRRLVITPEASHAIAPIVDIVLERAPKLPDWEFYPRRLTDDLHTVAALVHARMELPVDISEWYFTALVTDEGKVDLCYYCPNRDIDAAKLEHAAFVVTEYQVGEHNLNAWIGSIGGASDAPADVKLHSMLDFHRIVFDAIGQCKAMRALQPYHLCANDVEGYVVQVPEELWEEIAGEAHAFDAPRRDDLLIGNTLLPRLWANTRASGNLYDEEFSAHGEIFCYLKIEGGGELVLGDVESRADIEDALEALLTPTQLGAVIGAGFGARYSYIDLALTDVVQALPLIRQALEGRDISHRAWLLFFSCELADEWIGVFPDTPEPPRGE